MPEPIELLAPGESGPNNPRWHELRRAGVTASEIAAVMGLSPHDSPFNLFWSKLNDWRWGGNEYTSVGSHLEGAIAEWWACQQDDSRLVRPAGLYAHSERPWQLATPDRLVRHAVEGRPGVFRLGSLLECKWVAQSWEGWGEEGTSEIPVYYRAQALWQLDTLGVDEVHVAALGPTGFRAYLVRRDEAAVADLALMRAAGERFHRGVEAGEAPDLDGHESTISALRRLHPSVGEGDVEVSLELAERYRLARLDRDGAKDRVALCEAEIRAALGDEFSRAVYGKRLVASRSIFERTSEDEDELHALDDGYPITDRLNPGKKLEIPYA